MQMRVIKFHASLRYALSSAVFAGLWILEARAREKAATALHQLESQLEQRVIEHTSTLTAENAHLIELDQLKSKFIADAAHELRAPITALNLRLYLLEHAAPERHGQYLTEFKTQLARLTKLSEDLLAISRLDALDATARFGLVDLNHVVEDVVIAYRPMAETNGLVLSVEYNSALPAVWGDSQQLTRVGANLIANAIHYTESGQVMVRTLLDVERHQVCVEVQDTGVGIHAQDMPHLFERFYRGENTTGASGTGLGLSIVKEIVDLHGGSIHIESQLGKGSIFRVCLPLTDDFYSN
jgi:two-component system, OmpR family, phosphate regulon sensor histidine kinase PhoR